MVSATPIAGSYAAIGSTPARPQGSQNGRFTIEFRGGREPVVQMARTGALLVAAVYCFGALIVSWINAASSVRLALYQRS
jgi:hypothetical protein